MSVLHAYFNLRRQNDFQRCLEQSKASTSNSTGSQLNAGSGSGPGSRSWTKFSSFSTPTIDINCRDWLGRTVLHLACSAIDPASFEYTRLLLAHPQINVNIQDKESLWSPLHRALYSGNISAAVLLLQRSDIDMFLKDAEGYTPFDVYNSTVAGTNPMEASAEGSNAELYTWGSNRNAALGLGDGDDRTSPEQVTIKASEIAFDAKSSPKHLLNRLRPLSVTNVAMSKLHTTIITGEAKGNLRSCGFSSTGRLGSGGSGSSHTQFSFINPQDLLPHKIVNIALGQDHSLAVTSNGEVLSWGLNRFHQLGYAFEGKSNAQEDQVQSAARKVTGPLRNQVVIGVACSKSASACWTASQLFSWGTNHGQLGYERTGQPQIIPRLVSCVSEPILGVAMTDSAMLVLLKSRDVICLHEGNYWKLQFPVQRSFRAYNQPTKEKTEIRKVTASEASVGNFALISEAGDVYLFNTEEATVQRKDTTKDIVSRRPVPHLVWAVRRQFTAVKDVALGADGSMILCTKSGHVFVRSRILRAGIALGPSSLVNPPKSVPTFKFHRVPNLQRISHVCANSTGAFAALRHDATPESINLDGHTMADDLDGIQPFRSWARMPALVNEASKASFNETMEQLKPLISSTREDDDAADMDIAFDIRAAMELCDFVTLAKSSAAHGEPQRKLKPLSAYHGADLFFKLRECSIPVHSAVLSARAPAIRCILLGKSLTCTAAPTGSRKLTLDGTACLRSDPAIKVTGYSPITILILCYYLYADKVVTIWDRRVALAISDLYGPLNIEVLAIRSELQLLARQLHLQGLETATEFVGKRPTTSTLSADLKHIFTGGQVFQDVLLHLEDATVKMHSFVLRSRCPYFATFFNEKCWTENRFKSKLIEINLKEFKSRPMSYLFRYLYGEVTPELFDDLDFIHTSDQFIDFMFEIISCSNHFLLDRLIDLCSTQILRFADLRNVSATLADASHFNATSLVRSLHSYMIKNLETLMEMHSLDDLPQDVLKAFSKFLRGKQTDLNPYTRGGGNLPALEFKWRSWLNLQDFPIPFMPKYLVSHHKQVAIPSSQAIISRDAAGVSISMEPSSPITSRQRTIIKGGQGYGEDDIFPMDGDVSTSKLLASTSSLHKPEPSSPILHRVWKSPASSDRVDMRTIMEAERQAADAKRQSPGAGSPLHDGASRKWTPRSAMDTLSRNSPLSAGVLDGSPPTRKGIAVMTSAKASPLRPSPVPIQRNSLPDVHGSPSGPISASQQIMGTNSSSPTDTRGSSGGTASNLKKANPQQEKLLAATGNRLGPLIIPVKNVAAPKLTARRSASSEGPAWSNNRPALPAPRVPSQGLSFAAIQEQQATKAPVSGPPKTLREIQEEEQEIAFLMWFESESARVKKQEEEALSSVMAERQNEPNKKINANRRGRGGRERGRGKGRGQGRTMSEVST